MAAHKGETRLVDAGADPPLSSAVAASVKVTTRISVTDRGRSWALGLTGVSPSLLVR